MRAKTAILSLSDLAISDQITIDPPSPSSFSICLFSDVTQFHFENFKGKSMQNVPHSIRLIYLFFCVSNALNYNSMSVISPFFRPLRIHACLHKYGPWLTYRKLVRVIIYPAHQHRDISFIL